MSDSDRDEVVNIISNFYNNASVSKQNVVFVLNFLKSQVNTPTLFQQLEMAVENAESNPMSPDAIQNMKQSVIMQIFPVYNPNNNSRYMFDFVSMLCGYLNSCSN